MTHVAQPVLELHAGQPNSLDVGPLTNEDGTVINFNTGEAEEPELTILRLDGTSVVGVEGAPAFTWPVGLDPETVDGSQHWIADLTTLDVEHGERLRGVVEFVDPAGNPVTLIYRINVVPAV